MGTIAVCSWVAKAYIYQIAVVTGRVHALDARYDDRPLAQIISQTYGVQKW